MVYEPPIDLSFLPGYKAPKRTHRTAFLGRVSTKDLQDPRSSLIGQVAEASRLLAPGEEFVAWYWDVESGMLDLDERGLGTEEYYDLLDIPLPRNGGLPELVSAVERGEVTRAACERITRLARDMLTSLIVERELERIGVEVVCANEPQDDHGGGMTSGKLQARRGAQVSAEVFRTEMMEQSMRGQKVHAASGFNHGYAPYPYVSVIDVNAPSRATRFGEPRPKRRLDLHPDPRRVETAREMFRLRLDERAPDAEIRRLFAAAPDLHPIEGKWTINRITGLLANPKLSGYQVYNRKTRRGCGRNPGERWVWSREPAHPAIVTVEEWAETQRVTLELRTPVSPLDRIREAAHAYGLTMSPSRSTGTHVLWAIGNHQIVLPHAITASLADQVIQTITDAT